MDGAMRVLVVSIEDKVDHSLEIIDTKQLTK